MYKIIAEQPYSTVVSEYTPSIKNSNSYQSEDALEKEFINLLQANGYEYLSIKNNDALLTNLKHQLEKLNNITFSNKEWQQFQDNCLIKKNEGSTDKARKIQDDKYYKHLLTRDDGTGINIILIDKKKIHNNTIQVINQYEAEGNHKNRYDVTILVNGLPLVHIELKRRGVSIREAFNQINRYNVIAFGQIVDYLNIYKYL